MDLKFLAKVDEKVDDIMSRSDFAGSAARMAEARGLEGVEAIKYAAGLVDASRQRIRKTHIENIDKWRKQERARVQAIITDPAAQDQQDRALELALRTDLTAEDAIAELRAGCAAGSSDDASSLVRSIIGAGER